MMTWDLVNLFNNSIPTAPTNLNWKQGFYEQTVFGVPPCTLRPAYAFETFLILSSRAAAS